MTEIATNPREALNAWTASLEENRRQAQEIGDLRATLAERDAQIAQLIFEKDRYRDLWGHAKSAADHHQAMSAQRKASLIAMAGAAEALSGTVLSFSINARDAARDDVSPDIAPPAPGDLADEPIELPMFLQGQKVEDEGDDATGAHVDDDPEPPRPTEAELNEWLREKVGPR